MKTNTFKMMGLLLCFVAAIMVTSCNRDETAENGSNSQKIVGTWACTAQDQNKGSVGSVVTFKEDGILNDFSGVLINASIEGSGTWSIINDTLTVYYKCYDQWGNVSTSSFTYKILQLTNSELKLYGRHYNNYTYKFKKQ